MRSAKIEKIKLYKFSYKVLARHGELILKLMMVPVYGIMNINSCSIHNESKMVYSI